MSFEACGVVTRSHKRACIAQAVTQAEGYTTAMMARKARHGVRMAGWPAL